MTNRSLSHLAIGFATTLFGLTGTTNAQQQEKEPKRLFGIMNSFFSYHTDQAKHYNAFNPGVGFIYPLESEKLKARHITMDVEAGGYYNSIRGFTPFVALNFQKKITGTPVSLSLAVGVAGYREVAGPAETITYHDMPADKVVPASTESGGVRHEYWVGGDANKYIDKEIDKRARSTGPMHFYPVPLPRVCVDVIDNKKCTVGTALQGGWAPGMGGLVALSTYLMLKH